MLLKKLWTSPFILLILTVSFWGGNAVVGRLLSGEMGPVAISFFRILISVIIIVPFAYARMKKDYQIARGNIWLLVVLSATGVVGYNLLVYWSLNYTTAIHVTLINSSAPIFITVLSYFMIKEDTSVQLLISLVFSVVGVMWVMTGGQLTDIFHNDYNKGDLIMVAAVFCWALYSVLLKNAIRKMDSFSLFGYTLVIALPFILIAALIEIIYIPLGAFTLGNTLALLYLGLFPSVFAFLMWNQAIKLVGPSTSSIFINLTPVFGGVLAYVFLNESLTINHFIGGALVFLATIIVSRGKAQVKKEQVKAG